MKLSNFNKTSQIEYFKPRHKMSIDQSTSSYVFTSQFPTFSAHTICFPSCFCLPLFPFTIRVFFLTRWNGEPFTYITQQQFPHVLPQWFTPLSILFLFTLLDCIQLVSIIMTSQEDPTGVFSVFKQDNNRSAPFYCRWTTEEDKLLVEAVKEYGPHKWSLIAQHIPDRTPVQCSTRWLGALK